MAWSFDTNYKGKTYASVTFYDEKGRQITDVLENVFNGTSEAREATVERIKGTSDFLVKLASFGNKHLSSYAVSNVAKLELVKGYDEKGNLLDNDWEAVV